MCTEVTWTEGDYKLCRMKNACEDQWFGYDAVVLDECHVFVIICITCAGYMEEVTMTHMTLS